MRYVECREVDIEPCYTLFGTEVDKKDFDTCADDKDVAKILYKVISGEQIKYITKEELDNNYVAISDKGVSEQNVYDFVKEVHYVPLSDRITVARGILNNDFEIVETSACANADKYDKVVAEDVCIGKIYDQTQYLLNFLAQCVRKK